MGCQILESIKYVKSQVYKMDYAIDIAYACMIAKVPCLFIGNPGTGKSHTFKLIAKMFGQRDNDWFYQSITAKTSPEKLFGGIIAEQMLNGVETYNLDAGAATKKGNIFDELFKSQHPAMLNTLLNYFDEDPTIFSGGKNVKPQWEWAFTTTNFEDLDDDLRYNPLWDRMAAKIVIKELSHIDSKQALKMVMHQRKSSESMPSVTWADLNQARKAASQIEVPDSIIDTFYSKVLPTLEKWAYVSQRKINSLFVGKQGNPSIIQSLMYVLNDFTDEILGLIPYFVWSEFKSLDQMVKTVQDKLVLPVVKTYKEIKSDLEKFIDEVDGGKFQNYDAAKGKLTILLEGVNATVQAFSPEDRAKVPHVLRQNNNTLVTLANNKVESMINKVLDDMAF